LLLASHIQANGARQLFPCWDEPHLKATFTISIKHYKDFAVLYNTPFKILYKSDNDSVWTKFYTTPPMSTFQIAIVITNYRYMYFDTYNIRLWCDKCSRYNQSPLLKFTGRVIENITLHLRSRLSIINFPKMDHIAIPNFSDDGMSKWGFIFHR